MDLLEHTLAERGLSVRGNERFTGGWTVQRFAAHMRVDTVQIELKQRRYLDMTHDPTPLSHHAETSRPPSNCCETCWPPH